jgi:beta-glucosidase
MRPGVIAGYCDSITPDDLAHYPLGSVLNGGNSSPHGDELAPPGKWLAVADRFYDASLGAAGSCGIPLLWGTDAVHGRNNIPGATIFPHNIGLGATRDPALLRRLGEITRASFGSPDSIGRFPPARR